MRLIPVYLDPDVIDLTCLRKRFGSVIKKFDTIEEMEVWLKKARKLR